MVVSQPIYVVDGTVLSVTGTGLDAAIDGNGITRLFTVVNASLHLSSLSLRSGASVAGGAIASAVSSLVFNKTDFVDNRASS